MRLSLNIHQTVPHSGAVRVRPCSSLRAGHRSLIIAHL
jgi:hypothetical protein